MRFVNLEFFFGLGHKLVEVFGKLIKFLLGKPAVEQPENPIQAPAQGPAQGMQFNYYTGKNDIDDDGLDYLLSDDEEDEDESSEEDEEELLHEFIASYQEPQI